MPVCYIGGYRPFPRCDALRKPTQPPRRLTERLKILGIQLLAGAERAKSRKRQLPLRRLSRRTRPLAIINCAVAIGAHYRRLLVPHIRNLGSVSRLNSA